MPPLNKSSLVTAAIAFTIFAAMGIYSMISKQNTLLKEYPRVNWDVAISGKVVFKEAEKSITRIRLLNEQKFTLPMATNYNYSPPDLNIFLKPGDDLKKKSNSDSLFVLRHDQVYIFRLGEVLSVDR